MMQSQYPSHWRSPDLWLNSADNEVSVVFCVCSIIRLTRLDFAGTMEAVEGRVVGACGVLEHGVGCLGGTVRAVRGPRGFPFETS